MNQEFKPNYAIPPGETLQEVMEVKNWSVQDFSNLSDISISDLQGILNGEIKIEEDIAIKLNSVTGISRPFWLNLQKNYDATIHRLESEGKPLQRENGGRVSVIE